MLPDNGMRIAAAWSALALASIAFATIAHADGTGFFTAEQVTQGRLAYAADCSTCHGA